MKKYIAEIIGTFALIFCGTGSAIINEVTGGVVGQVGIGITFGLIVMTMIFTFGSTSGAHLNPAVSIGFSALKKLNRTDLLGYIAAQLLGAFLASYTLAFLFPSSTNLGATLPSGSQSQSFILEVILTFFLMLVILFVSQNKENSKFTPLAVGAMVGLEATFAGPICGASMNPARSIAPAMVSGNINSLWIYIVATIIGALLASFTWKYLAEEGVEN